MTLSCSKKTSTLLRGVTSKNNGDFYCLSCHHLFRTKNTLESYKYVCENKDFYGAVMPSESTKILEFNQYWKSNEKPSTIYADLQSLIKKVDGCKSNPEKSSITKVGEHVTCGYLMSTLWTLDGIENKQDVYRGEDCRKTIYESSREHTTKIIKFENEEMIPLTLEEYKSYLNQINCNICKKKIDHKYTNTIIQE